jgi:hypothetical protein
MVFSLDGKRLHHVPGEAEFKRVRHRLSADELRLLVADAERLCDLNDDVEARHLFPPDWNQPPWSAVLVACGGDQKAAERVVGYVLWTVLKDSSDSWTLHVDGHEVARLDPATLQYWR